MTIPVGFGQANLRFTGQGAPNGSEITLGFEHGAFPGDATAMAGTIYGHFAAEVLPNLSTLVQLVSVKTKLGPDATGPVGLWEVATSGSNVNDPGPPQVAVLVRKLTSVGGPRARGRWYIPGVPEVLIDASGNIDTTWLAALQVDLTSFFNKMVIDDLHPVLLHEPGISAEGDPTLMSGFAAQQLVATQRRRVRP